MIRSKFKKPIHSTVSGRESFHTHKAENRKEKTINKKKPKSEKHNVKTIKIVNAGNEKAN